jgi:energy-converting hydrogenase Eha subunit A
MRYDRTLACVSAVQLGCGVAGLATATRRGHAYDLPFLHGRRDRVARDSMVMGTALSAPLTMIGVQALAINRLRRGETDGTRTLLGVLGAVMTVGYLGERHVRHRLRPSGFDPYETPLIVVGIGSAVAMAALALTTPPADDPSEAAAS